MATGNGDSFDQSHMTNGGVAGESGRRGGGGSGGGGGDISGSLAARMLQGWCLLAESCPKCLIPLVRKSKGDPMECVSCGAHILTEAEAEARTSNGRSGNTPTLAPAEVAASGAPLQDQTARTTRPVGAGASRDTGHITVTAQDVARSAQGGLLPGDGLGIGPPGGGSAGWDGTLALPGSNVVPPTLRGMASLPDVVSSTIATLTDKMEELRLRIAAAQDPERVSQLLGALHELARTLKSLQAI